VVTSWSTHMECECDSLVISVNFYLLQYPDTPISSSLFPMSRHPVVHHIFNFHHVSRFLLQGCFDDLPRSYWILRRRRFIGRRKAISFTVGNSTTVVSSSVSSDSLTFKQTSLINSSRNSRFFFVKDLCRHHLSSSTLQFWYQIS